MLHFKLLKLTPMLPLFNPYSCSQQSLALATDHTNITCRSLTPITRQVKPSAQAQELVSSV